VKISTTQSAQTTTNFAPLLVRPTSNSLNYFATWSSQEFQTNDNTGKQQTQVICPFSSCSILVKFPDSVDDLRRWSSCTITTDPSQRNRFYQPILIIQHLIDFYLQHSHLAGDRVHQSDSRQELPGWGTVGHQQKSTCQDRSIQTFLSVKNSISIPPPLIKRSI